MTNDELALSKHSGVQTFYRPAEATAAGFDAMDDAEQAEWLDQHGIKPADKVDFKLLDGRTILALPSDILTLQRHSNAESQTKQANYFISKGHARLSDKYWEEMEAAAKAARGEALKVDSPSALTSDNPKVAAKLGDLRKIGPSAANYLRNRGLDPENLPPCIYGRKHSFKDAVSRLVAVAIGDDNKVHAMHEVYVTNEGKKAEPLSRTDDDGKVVWLIPESSKRTTGHIKGNPIKMGQGPLVLCEGLEDALSVYQHVPDHEVWCVGGVDNLSGAPVPANTTVTICRDGDDDDSAATTALNRAISRFQQRGCTVLVTQTPPGQDANSIGADALRRLIDEAVPAERVEGTASDAAEPDAQQPPQTATLKSLFPFNAAATKKRDWIIPGLLERGKITMIAGHAGAMKSLQALYFALSCVLQEDFGPWSPQPRFFDSQPLRVVMVNAEDDGDELKRRAEAAFQKVFKDARPDDDDLQDRLMFAECEMFQLVACDDEGAPKTTDTYKTFVQQLLVMKPDLVILDPLVELSTGIDENSAAMIEVLAAIRRIARKVNCAVLLVHHFAKAGSGKDQNAFRGSTAIGASVRTILNVERPDDLDIGKHGIKEEERGNYTKLSVRKTNYAAPGSEVWFHAVPCTLENGDLSVALEHWVPEQATITLEVVLAVLDSLERGRGAGPKGPMLWSHKDRANKNTKATEALHRLHGLTLDQAKDLLWDLQMAGFIKIGTYFQTDRTKAEGYEVVSRPTCWPALADVPFAN